MLPVSHPCSNESGANTIAGPVSTYPHMTTQINPRILSIMLPLSISPPLAFLWPQVPVLFHPQFLDSLLPTVMLSPVAIPPSPTLGLLVLGAVPITDKYKE